MGYKDYTEEYKLQIIDMLVESNYDYNRLTKETGIPSSTIRRWLDKYYEYTQNPDTIADQEIRKKVIDLRNRNEREAQNLLHKVIKTQAKAIGVVFQALESINPAEVGAKDMKDISTAMKNLNDLAPFKEYITGQSHTDASHENPSESWYAKLMKNSKNVQINNYYEPKESSDKRDK
jgi:transposase-like protein